MRTNQEYKNAALDRLRGNWSPAVVATLVYAFVVLLISGGSFSPILGDNANLGLGLWFGGSGILISFFVAAPLQVGYENATRLLYERRDINVTRNMTDMALSNYLHKVWGMFLMGLKLILWTMLFIIPGLVMAYAYAMTTYILEEHPEYSAWDASTRSRQMMKGHKFDLFYLHLSFIGWFLLSIFTFGIGLLWLCPYVDVATAAFYNDLKAEQGELAVND